MQYRHLDSPIGPLLVAGDDDGLRFLLFAHERRGKRDVKREPDWEPDRGGLKDAVKQLTAYFSEVGGFRYLDYTMVERSLGP